MEEKKIHITRQWIQSNKTFSSLKTGEPRTININDDVVYLIKEQIQVTRLKTMKYKCIDKSNTLLFMTRNGTPHDPHNLNKELKKIDINGKDVMTHYFRQTFITLMIENNIPLHLIAQHVAHKNLRMIQEVYNHFSNKMDHDLSSAIESLSISI